MIVTPPFNMDPMTASEFEDVLAAQRRAMMRDIPTSDATETPTLTRAELAEMLCDRVGLNPEVAAASMQSFLLNQSVEIDSMLCCCLHGEGLQQLKSLLLFGIGRRIEGEGGLVCGRPWATTEIAHDGTEVV